MNNDHCRKNVLDISIKLLTISTFNMTTLMSDDVFIGVVNYNGSLLSMNLLFNRFLDI